MIWEEPEDWKTVLHELEAQKSSLNLGAHQYKQILIDPRELLKSSNQRLAAMLTHLRCIMLSPKQFNPDKTEASHWWAPWILTILDYSS